MPKKVIKKEKKTCVKANSESAKAAADAKTTSNQFAYKLKMAPPHLRDFYDNKLKYSKATGPGINAATKAQFIDEIISGDFESTFFRQLTTHTKSDLSETTAEWMSWKQVTDKHGLGLVHAMVAQGTMLTAPHERLDPKHPSYEAISQDERLQYKEVTTRQIEGSSSVELVERGSDEAPAEKDPTAVEAEYKGSAAKVRKSRALFQQCSIDIKIKLGKFEGNRRTE
jgi:hypothetical protein